MEEPVENLLRCGAERLRPMLLRHEPKMFNYSMLLPGRLRTRSVSVLNPVVEAR